MDADAVISCVRTELLQWNSGKVPEHEAAPIQKTGIYLPPSSEMLDATSENGVMSVTTTGRIVARRVSELLSLWEKRIRPTSGTRTA